MVLFLFYLIEAAWFCLFVCFSHCGRDHVDDRQKFKGRCIVTQVEKILELLANRRSPASFDRLSLLIGRSDAVQHLSEELVTRRRGKGSNYSGPDGHLPEIEE